jgi:1,2-diacylglycerol 3-alpha-glucosyltransferase
VGTADVIHGVNVENYTRARPLVRPPHEIRLVPHFCAPVRDVPASERAALRAAVGVATPRVVLSVGAINRAHKRMDHVIDEVARLGPDWTLVLCGEAHEPDVLEHGRRALGSRFVATRLPRDRMAEAYALADVFVLASTQEGFGIAILEAMSAGLPVLLHDRPLFRWILDDPAACVDMTRPGALADAIAALFADPERPRASGERNRARFRSHFTWQAVRSDYLALAGVGPERPSR